jgi:hypothetical protein
VGLRPQAAALAGAQRVQAPPACMTSERLEIAQLRFLRLSGALAARWLRARRPAWRSTPIQRCLPSIYELFTHLHAYSAAAALTRHLAPPQLQTPTPKLGHSRQCGTVWLEDRQRCNAETGNGHGGWAAAASMRRHTPWHVGIGWLPQASATAASRKGGDVVHRRLPAAEPHGMHCCQQSACRRRQARAGAL